MARTKTARRGHFGMLENIAQMLGGLMGGSEDLEERLDSLSPEELALLSAGLPDDLEDADWDEDWDEDEEGLEDGQPATFLPQTLTPADLLAGGQKRDDPVEAMERDQIAQALAQLTVAQLRTIASRWGWKLSGQKREDVLASLKGHYSDEASLAKARSKLSPDDRRLISLVRALQVRGALTLPDALDRLSADPATALRNRDGYFRVQRAVAQGLLLDLGRELVIPQGLFADGYGAADLLPPADLSKLTVDPAPDPLRSLALWGQALAADSAVLTLRNPLTEKGLKAPPGWRPGTPLATLPPQEGGAGQRSIPAVGSSFAPEVVARLQGDLGLRRASSAELLLWVFGGLSSQVIAGQPRHADAEGHDELAAATMRLVLGLTAPDLLDLYLQLWMNLPYGTFDEWSWARLEDPTADFDLQLTQAWTISTDAWQQGLVRSRRDILWRILGRLGRVDRGQGGWLDMTAFLRLAGLVEPRSAMGGHEGWMLTDQKGQLLTDWAAGGARVWRVLIESTLHALGLVDLARDAGGAAQALRLSAAGLALFDRQPPEALTAADAHWTAPDTLDLPLTFDYLALLNRVRLGFRLERATGDRAVFRLDQDACRDSFRAGGDADAIERNLAAAGLPLPPAAAEQLRRWWASWGLWMLRTGWSLLSFADESIAREVLTTSALHERLVCRLSPTQWLVDPAQEDKLLAALQRAGHRPMVLDARGGQAPQDRGGR